jgi:hypothetical protein
VYSLEKKKKKEKEVWHKKSFIKSTKEIEWDLVPV